MSTATHAPAAVETIDFTLDLDLPEGNHVFDVVLGALASSRYESHRLKAEKLRGLSAGGSLHVLKLHLSHSAAVRIEPYLRRSAPAMQGRRSLHEGYISETARRVHHHLTRELGIEQFTD